MGYESLGATLPIVAAADATGMNAGNLTIALDDSANLPKIGNFVIWHMVLEDVPPGAAAVIKWNNSRTWSFVSPQNGGCEWNGNLPMRQSDALYFLWNIPAPGTAGQIPQVTVYSMYDPSLPGNS